MHSKHLLLRELTAADVRQEYLDWFKDEEVTRFLEVDGRTLTIQNVIDYIQIGKESRRYFMYAICLKESGDHIGNLKVGPIDWKHLTSDLVTVIGDRSHWGKGYATEAIKLGNRVAFEIHKLRKLSGGMYSSNVGSLKAYTNAGWIVEGRLANHYLLDGKLEDRVIVSCFNPTFDP